MMNNGSKAGGNGSQACASCKYQRRKCNSDCPLAPYFPPDQQKQFLNAHRLFGVSNILKILKNLDPAQQPEAMKTIIFQANMRNKDPVRGCLGVIEDLKKQIDWIKAELDITLGHVHTIKQQLQIHNGAGAPPHDSFAMQQFHGGPPPFIQPQQPQHHHHMGALSVGHVSSATIAMAGGMDPGFAPANNMSFAGGSAWVQQPQMHGGESSSVSPKPETTGLSSPGVGIQDCDEFKPFIDLFDDRQPFVNPKETLECSGESSFKEEQQDHELKQAAQLFSLRNNIDRDSQHM
ncbi:unnamed protein product [Victoria cruziana]